MAENEWTSIFKRKAINLNKGDTWRLEFDDSLVPKRTNFRWKEYIRNTSARFRCSTCRRSWPSNCVKVVFHMRLSSGGGVVKVRRICQECKMCDDAPMVKPSIESHNINILMENLVQKIRIKCYHENLERECRPFVDLKVKSPHEPDHCEACTLGICNRK